MSRADQRQSSSLGGPIFGCWLDAGGASERVQKRPVWPLSFWRTRTFAGSSVGIIRVDAVDVRWLLFDSLYIHHATACLAAVEPRQRLPQR